MTAASAGDAREREPVVVGLGGNVGDPPQITARFAAARGALAAVVAPGSLRSAPLYLTAPVGPAQPPYLNTALGFHLDAEPAALLAILQELERRLGRDRSAELRWGPRPIDLDLLVWGARTLRTPSLELPHPRLAARRFALAPLVALLGPGFEIAGHGPAGALLARVADQLVEELAATW